MTSRILSVVPLILLLTQGRAQAPCMEFHALSGGGGEQLRSLAVDADGATYYTGWFADSLAFGDEMIVGVDHNEFVAKVDATGDLVWYHVFCTDMFSTGTALVVDDAGGVFLTGDYVGQLTFGTCTYNHPGSSDIFVAKLNAESGSCEWVATGSSIGYAHARAITVAEDGTVRAAGGFWGYCTFGDITLNCTGTMSPFVAAYAADGTGLWAKQVVDGTGGQGEGVCTDATGNTFLVGSHGSAADFGNGVSLPSQGSFLAKYDATGTAVWARPGLGNYTSVRSGDNGAVYAMAGNPGGVVKYNALGDTLWSTAWGEFSSSFVFRDAHLWVAAMYQTELILGDDSITSPNTYNKVALLELDDTGELVMMQGFENNGLSNVGPASTCFDGNGDPVVGGTYTCSHTNQADTILGLPWRAGGFVLRGCASNAIDQSQWPMRQLSLFPNPANTMCTLAYELAQGVDHGTCALFDPQGRLVQRTVLSPHTDRVELDLRSLAPGSYTCCTDISNGVRSVQHLVVVR